MLMSVVWAQSALGTRSAARARARRAARSRVRHEATTRAHTVETVRSEASWHALCKPLVLLGRALALGPKPVKRHIEMWI